MVRPKVEYLLRVGRLRGQVLLRASTSRTAICAGPRWTGVAHSWPAGPRPALMNQATRGPHDPLGPVAGLMSPDCREQVRPQHHGWKRHLATALRLLNCQPGAPIYMAACTWRQGLRAQLSPDPDRDTHGPTVRPGHAPADGARAFSLLDHELPVRSPTLLRLRLGQAQLLGRRAVVNIDRGCWDRA